MVILSTLILLILSSPVLELTFNEAVLNDESKYYEVVDIPTPEGVLLEVGGLVAGPGEGVVYVSTRRGDIWKIENTYSETPKFTLFSDGLQEPLGLQWHNDWLYTVQRGELSRLRDEDGDGRADVVETVCDDWSLSGNYHEYAFGPRIDKEGNFWITLNKPFGAEPFGRQHWRGWAIKVEDPDQDGFGRMIPAAGGLRSPAGVEVAPWGDVFYTDNQGEWCGTNKLCHIEEGDYFGHVWGVESAKLPISRMKHPGETPDGKTYVEVREQIPFLKLPAVWFPYDKMGKSAAGMVWDTTEGGFGPFANQLLVTDQHHASVMRVDLEKVNGVWQGACYPFREGFSTGILNLQFTPEGNLLSGGTNRGWPVRGRKAFALERIDWTGRMPFEIKQVSITPKGFSIAFTKPLDRSSGIDPKHYRLSTFTHIYHGGYGGPEVDQTTPVVKSVTLSENGKSASIEVPGIKPGHVYEFDLGELRDAEKTTLLHRHAYYTVNEIPEGK